MCGYWREKCKDEERIAAKWEAIARKLAEDLAGELDGIDGKTVTAQQILNEELERIGGAR